MLQFGAMEIRRTPPRYPRRGPSCLGILIFIGVFGLGFFLFRNRQMIAENVLPQPTPTPTQSPANLAVSAALHVRDGELTQAIEKYQEVIQIQPEIRYYIELIRLLGEAERTAEALDLVEQALEIAPNDAAVYEAAAGAHLAHGDYLQSIGDNVGARREYGFAAERGEASADLDPSNSLAKAYMAAGLVREDIANWQVAGVFVRDAQQQIEDQVAAGTLSRNDADIPLVLYHTAEVITVAGQYSEAALLLEQAIDLKPDYTAASIDLAYIMFNVEQQNITAIRLLERALEENPNDAVLLDTLAQFNIIGTGDFAAAEEYARRAVEQNPEMLRAHARLAHAYFKNFNYPSAIEELRIATDGYKEPDATTSFYFALLGLALYFEDTANCTEAEPILRAAFEASVENSPGWLNAEEGLRLCREAGFASP